MNIKTIIQLFLLIILGITFGVYYYFYQNTKIDINSSNKEQNTEITISEKSSNIIKKIFYTSTDSLGNKFEIRSELGEINIENPDIVNMTDVYAVIYIVNSDPISIKSKFAKYNKNNYETNFKKNVLLNYQNQKIRSQNLDLSFENNLATIYNEIVYNNDNAKLYADILKIDLITKNSRIFMDNNYKKVKIYTEQ
tara:strand:+ start:4489 stop:5073 length:585 start_codon:yes stop_codon:yes gene_type:complete